MRLIFVDIFFSICLYISQNIKEKVGISSPHNRFNQFRGIPRLHLTYAIKKRQISEFDINP